MGLVKKIGKNIASSYCITGTIGEGAMGSVLKAIPFEDSSRSVAIKIIQRDHKLDSEDLLRFQKEAALMSRLYHPNIVTFHELGLLNEEEEAAFGSGAFIVMEVVDGSNLKDFIKKSSENTLNFLFQVGEQVASALDYIHGKGIIHRDIKPQNIVIERKRSDSLEYIVKVLDFGVARLGDVMHFTGGDGSVSEIAGTPLYMAPELTSYSKVDYADHRVDLYSLGCVLYETIAGEPPFVQTDRQQIAHLHGTEKPRSLCEIRSDIPVVVDKMIQKLLEKHPDDRYHSAFSFLYDLRKIRDLLHYQKFELDKIDIRLDSIKNIQALSLKLPLIGRQREFDSLLKSYHELVKGTQARSRISTVRGDPGVGKRRLLAEVRNYFTENKIRYVSGEFSRHEYTLPFNALANAFNEYLLRVMKSQPLEKAQLEDKIKSTLGEHAHLLASVIPALEPYIESIPSNDVEYDVEGKDFNTFTKAFSDFTRCLVLDDHPVVFIFENVHWADEKSLSLVNRFFSNNNTQRFYLIVSFRPHMYHENDAFKEFINKFSRLKRRSLQVDVTPLSKPELSKVVEAVLGGEVSWLNRLIDYLEPQISGNPRQLIASVRKLVEEDYIVPNYGDDSWSFNEKELNGRKLSLNSIDLVLGKIRDIEEKHLKILQIASSVGMAFSPRLLIHKGISLEKSVFSTINWALREGFIHREHERVVSNEMDEKYVFAHYKARDEIYDQIEENWKKYLHRLIAAKLSEFLDLEKEKDIFFLAQHYVRGLDEGVNLDYLNLCFKYNFLAAAMAEKAHSYQAADRYYKICIELKSNWNESVAVDVSIAQIIEKISDLSAKQGHYGRAIKGYRHILKMKVPLEYQSLVTYKIVHFQLVGGVISDSLKLLQHMLKKLGKPIPDVNFRMMAHFWMSIARDIFWARQSKKSSHALLKSYVNREEVKVIDSSIRLYHSGQVAWLNDNYQKYLVYHNHAMLDVVDLKVSNERALRTILDRSIILARFGFFRKATKLMEHAKTVAATLQCEKILGYSALLEAQHMHYPRGYFERAYNNLIKIEENESFKNNRLHYAELSSFKSYLSLLFGDLDGAISSANQTLRIISARNTLAAKSISLLLLTHLLREERDAVVVKGERFLKKRSKLSGRMDDTYVLLIEVMVHLAKGNVKKTRISYLEAFKSFSHRVFKQEFLHVYEYDFMGFFFVSLPAIFAEEEGRNLMRDEEIKDIYSKITRIFSFGKKKPSRSSVALLQAKVAQELYPKHCNTFYDQTKRMATLDGAKMIHLMSMIWLGMFEFEEGQKETLRAAHEYAVRNHMIYGEKYIEKVMHKRGFVFNERELSAVKMSMQSVYFDFSTNLALDALHYLSEPSSSEVSFEGGFLKMTSLLHNNYSGDNAIFIFSEQFSQKQPMIASQYEIADMDALLRFIAPYANIMMTLPVPSLGLPWNTVVSDEGLNFDDKTLGATLTNQLYAVNRTEDFSRISREVTAELLASSADDTYIPSAEMDATVVDSIAESQLESARSSSPIALSTITPVIGKGGVIYGVLLIENIGEAYYRDTVVAKKELDLFGCQLGLLFEKSNIQLLKNQSQVLPSLYRAGEYQLEHVSWLKLWEHGQLRLDRETTWYLGQNLNNDNYLLVYCSFEGPQSIRDQISIRIWAHLKSMRDSYGEKLKVNFDAIRDDLIFLLQKDMQVKQLKGISLAFTLFNRVDKSIISGHFGPARPLTIGGENRIEPLNESIVVFESQKELRYWKVVGAIDAIYPYIVSYDTSRLNIEYSKKFTDTITDSLIKGQGSEELHRVFRDKMYGHLPRCYVAALWKDEEDAEASLKNIG